MNEVKKAIIPVAGLGTRFLPLSKVLPKELFPVVDKPMLQYVVEEALASGVKEIIFVTRPEKKEILNYFKKYFKELPKLTKILEERKKNHILEDLKEIEKFSKEISLSQVFQKEPLGDGHAILQAKEKIQGEPIAVLWGDDLVESKNPCLLQLIRVFKEYQKPVIALCQIPNEKLPSYGIVEVEKLKERVYKIKKIIEKPSIKEAPSNLAIVGKYVLTPEVFEYLSGGKRGRGGEIYLSENLQKMIEDGKEILGLEFEGKWLECGNKVDWMASYLYLTLKNPKFGPKIREALKEYLE